MEPNGDPEARIRDLERPLADRAAESELGTRPYENAAPPPPPPPPTPPYGYTNPTANPTANPTGADPYQGGSYDRAPQYGSPYYAEPQRVVHKRSASTALWLIPLVVLAFVAAGVVGAVLYFSVGSPSPGTPIAGGGGPLDAPQSQNSIPAPEIETRIDSTEQIITVDAGGVVSLGGVETTQTIVCNQGAVNISGVSNTIEIQGTCASVNVSGVENIVTMESAATIDVSGFQNRVTYRGGEPAISRSGSDNVVEQG